MFLNPFSPLDVGEDLVNGKTKKFSIHLTELIIILLERNEFGRTDWSEVSWMAKKNKPFAGIIIRQSFWTMSGLDLHGW